MDDGNDKSMLDVLNGAVDAAKLRPKPAPEPPKGSINFMGQDDPFYATWVELEQAKSRIKQLEADVAYWRNEHTSAIKAHHKALERALEIVARVAELRD